MWGDMGSYGWGWFGVGLVHMLLFWGLIILGIVALVRWMSGGIPGGCPREKTPLDILKERYARGDIDDEEYERRRKEVER